jgi:two-component system, NtrC family, sensor kinase
VESVAKMLDTLMIASNTCISNAFISLICIAIGLLLYPSLHKLTKANVQLKHELRAAKQAEAKAIQQLEQTEQQTQLLRTVIDSTPDWIFAKDQNFRYIFVNQGYASALNKTAEEMLGKDDLDLGFPEELVLGDPDQGKHGFRIDDRRVLSGETIHNSHDPATYADGSLHIFDTQKFPLYNAQGQVIAALGFARDITGHKQAEVALQQSEAQLREKAYLLEQTLIELQHTQAQLIQTEKMSSLGQLVAGVAHEINNPVNFIYGNLIPAGEYIEDLLGVLELYQQHYPDPLPIIRDQAEAIELDFIVSDLPKLLSSMKIGADRIRQIVLSLRSFSRLDESEQKSVDIHEGIESTLLLLQYRLKAKPDQRAIEVIKDYGELPLVECYAGQLNQVLMNLLTNAIDALEEKYRQEPIQAASPTIHLKTQRLNSNWIRIQIADNGSGISEAAQTRLFDPFFTTKAVGQGTGLGLAISYQIVTDKHGGKLMYHSVPKQGTEFTIDLPI